MHNENALAQTSPYSKNSKPHNIRLAMNPTTTPDESAALLCLWNDIASHRIDEYNRWHTLEHVPERVWVPGYVSGTRYLAATDAQVRYFTLYEMTNLACLQSPEYQDLVDNPTPWSALMRPSFSNFLRKTGPVAVQAGSVLGCAASLVRWVWPQVAAPSQGELQGMADHLLGTGATLGLTRVRIQRVENVGPQALGNVDRAPAGAEYIGIVESFEPDRFDSLSQLVESVEASHWRVAPLWREAGGYRLVSHVLHADVKARARPASRLDLMPR